MTEIKELVEKLHRLDALFVEIYNYADSQSKSFAVGEGEANALRAIKNSIGNRYNVIPQAASALEALISRSAVMEEALRPFAAATLLNQSAVIVAGDGITQAFDSGKKHVTCLMEEDAGPAFNRARSALSLKAGKE
jgi:hypothetical protein